MARIRPRRAAMAGSLPRARLVRSSPHDDIEILDALGEVDRPAARALLVAAVNQRRAGHAFGRQYAIRSLIRLADPQVPDLLVDW